MNESKDVSAFNYWTEPHNFFRFLSDAAWMRIGEINISNSSANPDLERDIVENTASYGRQLGWMLEALEVIARKIEQMPNMKLTKEEHEAFTTIYMLHRWIEIKKKDAAK